jgi:uncharacterized protein (TIGR02145 family)
MKNYNAFVKICLMGLLFLAYITCKKETPKTLPTLTTSAVTIITANTAIAGSEVTTDGGDPVTVRGVCWSTNENPTIADSKTSDGTGTGSFSSTITGLIPNTTYYVRSYATNKIGTAYGPSLSYKTLSVETLLQNEQAYPNINGEPITISLDGVQVTCLKISGELIYQGDIILSTPTKGSALNSFNFKWPNNTVYYEINNNFPRNDRITNAIKEYETKTNLKFKQRLNEPNFIEFIWDSNGCSSYLGMIAGRQPIRIADWGNTGTVVHEIGHAIGLLHEQSKKGRDNYITILWENIISGMEHNFKEYTNSLNTNDFDFKSIMLYHSWGFSKNNKPTIIRKDGSTFIAERNNFSNSDLEIINLIYTKLVSLPVLTTAAATSLTAISAATGGNVTSNGNGTIISRGVCWSTSSGPTIANTKTSDGIGEGAYTSIISPLIANTTYFARAYATNSAGTAYGVEIIFKTLASLPTVTTAAATAITTTTISSGGNVTIDGGAAVAARGVCWATTSNPTINNSKTTDGTGTGSFVSAISGLTSGTTYYVRAYATNIAGTAYGNQVSFTTSVASGATVTDVDGNIYKTVTIGSQVWMKENLKTTKFKDGTTIPLVTDKESWPNLLTPGYCWYNNDATTNKDSYGGLYNWYTVNTGKLCPDSWHVPSEDEWTTLINKLGGVQVAGGKLKEFGSSHWASPNTDANNEVGFSALPGGYRLIAINIMFSNIGICGYWWSSTEGLSKTAGSITMWYNKSVAAKNFDDKWYGFSVRCLKD